MKAADALHGWWPDRTSARRAVQTGALRLVTLVSWSAVYLVVLLAALAGIVRVTSGWDAVVITSGSMSPTVRTGDVLFIADPPEELLGQQSVITFAGDDGELVTHRIFEVRADEQRYVTKGDANPTPDVEPVDRDRVVGVGRIVVPYLGLPVVWARTGDLAALAALSIVLAAALAAVVSGARRERQAGGEADGEYAAVAQRGIGRVRVVVALMISMQLLIDGRQFELDAPGLTRGHTLLVALAALAAIGLVALARSRSESERVARRLALAELVGDTLIVVFFVAASGSSGIGWILMALPIIEAAIHFRLTGAFLHWMVMSGLTVGVFFWMSANEGASASEVLGDLEQLVDRLGVLLLVVIPGSYLAEQLLGDVVRQRRATNRARERSQLMELVTEVGHDITRLGGNPFETLLDATRRVGFDIADVWSGHPDRGWQQLAIRTAEGLALPAPGAAGSTLRPTDISQPEVLVDPEDPDPAESEALGECGLVLAARILLSSGPRGHVALRAGVTESRDDTASRIMALRLLCDQAAVALQNEQLISELRTTHAELEHQAMYDQLTGLANRARFVGLLGDALRERMPTGPRPVTVLFLDLNGFKAVNDRLGHHAGDELLVKVAGRLLDAAQDRGVVARLGGDEFTVLLGPDQETLVADELADAVHLALLEPFEISGEQVRVGTSIGIAHSEPGIGASEMLRRADAAMYTAKAMDSAWRTAVYHDEMDEAERRQGRIARAFKLALEEHALHLAYQPIVESATGAIVGAEALVRWEHPELGHVPPPMILEVAELTGNVHRLNAWIFRTALVDIASCRPLAGEPPFVAVNVSPEELELETLRTNMEAALDASGLRPERVVVELSERMVAMARGSLDNVNHLVGMGLGLALDDFGEGQTALAHLRSLPITFLKLDRLFVLHAGESADDRTILASVVDLAHDLGCSVIAEGVETPEHREIVERAGAELMQGYGLYRPMPIAALRRLVKSATAGSTYRRPPLPAPTTRRVQTGQEGVS